MRPKHAHTYKLNEDVVGGSVTAVAARVATEVGGSGGLRGAGGAAEGKQGDDDDLKKLVSGEGEGGGDV